MREREDVAHLVDGRRARQVHGLRDREVRVRLEGRLHAHVPRRRDLVRPVLVEFGCLGLCAGALAVGLGGAAGYAVVARLMHADWTFLPLAAIGPAAAGALVTLLFGLAGTRRLLAVKPLAWLRNE